VFGERYVKYRCYLGLAKMPSRYNKGMILALVVPGWRFGEAQRNQLRILRTKIENNDCLGVHSLVWQGRRRDVKNALFPHGCAGPTGVESGCSYDGPYAEPYQ
jgi:hypothetical protein